MAPIIIPIPPRITGRSYGPPMSAWEQAWFFGSAVLAALVLFWFMGTALAWLMPHDEPRTLWQVLKGQGRWLRVLLTTGKVPR